jgi:hypothetical protein
MAAVSPIGSPSAPPSTGVEGGRPNLIRGRLLRTDRGAVQAALGKGDTWVRDVLNDNSGVCLDDLPLLLAQLGLKVVGLDKVVVDPDVLNSLTTLHIKLAPLVASVIRDDEV